MHLTQGCTRQDVFRKEKLLPEVRRLYDARNDKSVKMVAVGEGWLREVMRYDPRYVQLGVDDDSKWRLEVVAHVCHSGDLDMQCTELEKSFQLNDAFFPRVEKLSWTNAIRELFAEMKGTKKRQRCADDDLARGAGRVFDVQKSDDGTYRLRASPVQPSAMLPLPWDNIRSSVASLETVHRKRDDSLIAMTIGFDREGAITCVYVFQKQYKYDDLNRYIGSYSSALVKEALETSYRMQVVDIGSVERPNRTIAEGLAYEAAVSQLGPYIVPQIPVEKLVRELTPEQRYVCENNAKLRHLLHTQVGCHIEWPSQEAEDAV